MLKFFKTYAQVEPYVRGLQRELRFKEKGFAIRIECTKDRNGKVSWSVESKALYYVR